MTSFSLGVLVGVAATVVGIFLFMLTWGREATLVDQRARDELGLDDA